MPKPTKKSQQPTPSAADSSQAERDLTDRTRDRTGEKHARATKALVNQRNRQVYRMLMQGFSRAAILDHATDAVRDSYEHSPDAQKQRQREYNRRLWDISDRQIEDRIRDAREIIDAQGKVENEELFNLTSAQLADLYLQNYKIQDFKSCLATLKTRMELHGLARTAPPPDPSALGAQAGAAAALTVEQWKAQAAERTAEAAQTLAMVGKALEAAEQ